MPRSTHKRRTGRISTRSAQIIRLGITRAQYDIIALNTFSIKIRTVLTGLLPSVHVSGDPRHRYSIMSDREFILLYEAYGATLLKGCPDVAGLPELTERAIESKFIYMRLDNPSRPSTKRDRYGV